jgi:tetratricopeptide (TPR) repeat protein
MTQEAAKIDPLVAQAITRAFELDRAKQRDSAIEIMTALAADVPTVWQVQFVLALFLVRNGRFNEAVDHGQLAVEQAPKSAKASMVLYRALGGAGLYVEALEEAKRYLSTAPSGEYAEILRGLKAEIEVELEKDGSCES